METGHTVPDFQRFRQPSPRSSLFPQGKRTELSSLLCQVWGRRRPCAQSPEKRYLLQKAPHKGQDATPSAVIIFTRALPRGQRGRLPPLVRVATLAFTPRRSLFLVLLGGLRRRSERLHAGGCTWLWAARYSPPFLCYDHSPGTCKRPTRTATTPCRGGHALRVTAKSVSIFRPAGLSRL